MSFTEIFSHFLAGLIGLFIRNFFEGFGFRFPKNLGQRIKASLRSRRPHSSEEWFSIGYQKTSMCIIDGDGETVYAPDTLVAIYRDVTPESPTDIAARIFQKEKELEAAREAGNDKVWNGIGVGISDYTIKRDNPENFLAMNIEFYKSTYTSFQATVLTIGTENRHAEESIYTQHIKGRSPREIIDYLARQVGVVVVVVTADNWLLVAVRSDRVSVRAGEFDASVVEGIEPIKDGRVAGSIMQIDIYATVSRGCQEELGFIPELSQIKILGFAVDMQFYQYNFFSYVESKRTLAEHMNLRPGKARDNWEFTMRHIKFTPEEVLSFLSKEKNNIWSPEILAIYWALVYKFGKVFVEPIAIQNFPSVKSK